MSIYGSVSVYVGVRMWVGVCVHVCEAHFLRIYESAHAGVFIRGSKCVFVYLRVVIYGCVWSWVCFICVWLCACDSAKNWKSTCAHVISSLCMCTCGMQVREKIQHFFWREWVCVCVCIRKFWWLVNLPNGCQLYDVYECMYAYVWLYYTYALLSHKSLPANTLMDLQVFNTFMAHTHQADTRTKHTNILFLVVSIDGLFRSITCNITNTNRIKSWTTSQMNQESYYCIYCADTGNK